MDGDPSTQSSATYPAQARLTHEPRGSGWRARLGVELVSRDGATVLGRTHHEGPLRIQQTFHPEGPGTAHVYVLHPPGGVVSSDRLEIGVDIRTGAHGLFTMPGAAKLYRARSESEAAQIIQTLRVSAGAVLEWLPQETIAFRGARAQSMTRVLLEGDARFVGWEMLCLGRPAAGEDFESGAVEPHLEVYRDGRPIWLDRSSYVGGDRVLSAPWGLNGFRAFGTMVMTHADHESVRAVREGWEQEPLDVSVGRTSATLIRDLLLIRGMATQARHLRSRFGLAWSLLRPLHSTKIAVPPRIWVT